MANKRMKLIPEQLYNQLMVIAKNGSEKLEEEKASVLEGSLPDEIKVMLYQQAARNLFTKEKNISNTPILVKNVDPPQEITVSSPTGSSPSAVLATVVGVKRAPMIFIYLRKLNILPNTNNEITIDGNVLQNSNYTELLQQLSGNSKMRRIGGIDQVVNEMQKHQYIPRHLFSKSVYNELSPSKENNFDTPKNPSPRTTRSKRKLKWTGV